MKFGFDSNKNKQYKNGATPQRTSLYCEKRNYVPSMGKKLIIYVIFHIILFVHNRYKRRYYTLYLPICDISRVSKDNNTILYFAYDSHMAKNYDF